MDDRRIFERIPADIPVRFWGSDANIAGEGRVCDVSAGGMGLSISRNIGKGSGLGVWVDLPGGGRPLYLQGQVAWSSEDQGQCRVGVALERVKLMLLSRLLGLNTVAKN